MSEPDLDPQRWTRVTRCPACAEESASAVGQIEVPAYFFGPIRLALPPGGIQIKRCERCSLVYKCVVPTPGLIAEVTAQGAHQVWGTRYHFDDEVALCRRVLEHDDFDLLDVGAAGGAFLQALAQTSRGRLSAMDVIGFEELRDSLRGEFIAGPLERSDLSWSQRPYDAVTAFDVFEHLTDPPAALDNLAQLTKPGGIVVVETGDAEAAWPTRYGIGGWYYAVWVVHNMFWTRRSLVTLFAHHGFELLSCNHLRHKAQRQLPPSKLAKELVKLALFHGSPHLYRRLAALRGAANVQPCNPFSRDHLRAVFRYRPAAAGRRPV
jgi:SAM-dependent methyltransferase